MKERWWEQEEKNRSGRKFNPTWKFPPVGGTGSCGELKAAPVAGCPTVGNGGGDRRPCLGKWASQTVQTLAGWEALGLFWREKLKGTHKLMPHGVPREVGGELHNHGRNIQGSEQV